MSDLQKRFEAAQAAATRLRDKPDNDTLLELYSYFKQAHRATQAATGPGPSISSPAPNTTPGRPARA